MVYIPPLQVYRNFSETQTGTFSTEREREVEAKQKNIT